MSLYISSYRLACRMTGRDFDKHVESYYEKRGMNFYNDVHDWVGGYPYQSITPSDCQAFFGSLGFQLEREFVRRQSVFSSVFGSGCDEFVFRKWRPDPGSMNSDVAGTGADASGSRQKQIRR